MSESKLDDTILDGELEINGYDLIRSSRNRHEGGVACYIKKDRAYNMRENISLDFEHLFFDILSPNCKRILIVILYRPPKQCGFLEKVSSAIAEFENFDEQEVYILGDLNYDLTDDNNRYILDGNNYKKSIPTKLTVHFHAQL